MTGTADSLDAHCLLAPILPAGAPSEKTLRGEAAGRLAHHWARLQEMGFQLELRKDSLAVHHGGRGFEHVVQLSHPDDLGERRALFNAVKASFGRLSDRFFPWLFQPSPDVTRSYESLKEVISTCQAIRQQARAQQTAG
jgi:hypothetical protein